MAGQKHTQFKGGAGFSNIVDNDSNPISTAKLPYIRTFWVDLPLVASSSAQAIAYANIPDWPATYARVISAGVDVITAEATGTTKNVSFGYAGATTAFVNAQSAAAIGVIPGAGAVANLNATALSYTLSANDWAEAVMKAWITVECID
jgi:hypothetical protein